MSSCSHPNISFLQFEAIFDASLKEYAQKTGMDLAVHPLATILEVCDSPEAVLGVLREQAHTFDEYRYGDGKVELMRRLKPTVDIVFGLSTSGIFGEGIGLMFPPAKAIFAGVGVLLAAAKGVSTSHDALIDLFECFEQYLSRLKIFTEIPSAMGELLIKIMVELLGVLALVTQQIKLGRFKKFAKKLLGENDIEAVLQRLDRLTTEESRMTAAQTMQVVHGLFNNVKVVIDEGRSSTDKIQRALTTTQQIVDDLNKVKHDELREKIRTWLSPPDPSVSHNIACDAHHSGTATWFIESNVYNEWKERGSLLWLHGKPGSGKSVLCSSIIEDIEGICVTGLASVAYYYCYYMDVKKQDRHGLLTSLLIQLCARFHRGYDILSSLHAAYDNGLRQPSDGELIRCLQKVLALRGQGKVYIIVDALDECPTSNGFPKTAREKVLDFLEELLDLKFSDLRICVTSRPEIDIQIVLEPLISHHISLHDESGQKEDIFRYVSDVVMADRKMRRWRLEDKQRVINTLSAKADGMFRWIVCQLDMLRRCFPASLHDALDKLPQTLDETYERILLGVDEERCQYAIRLFQCLAVSVRPLRIEELADILAMRFESGTLPHYHVGWRPEDPGEAVLSACSSLVAIVDINGSQIVQFSHFSVKEFLTSNRLAEAAAGLSHYHIDPPSAHTTIAQASLSVLLHLDGWVNKKMMENFPFAFYAAQHWMVHCRFGDISKEIQDAMGRLFDAGNSPFRTWLWIFDIDHPFREHMFTAHPTRPEAVPLYYATLCGFPDLVDHLLSTHPKDVNARGGYRATPLHAALSKGDFEMMKLLLERGADVDALDWNKLSALHIASRGGRCGHVKLLLGHHANANIKDGDGETPLIAASCVGELEVARVLLRHGAAVDVRDCEGWTPLYAAARYGHLNIVWLLIQSGATVNYSRINGWTPLFTASRYGHVDIVRLLIQSGAAVDSREIDGWTPLFAASRYGHLDVVRLLVHRCEVLDSPENTRRTPLFVASQYGHLDIVQLLIQCGAVVDSPRKTGQTPLFVASKFGHLDVVRLLIQCGAAVNSHENSGRTPLIVASEYGHTDIVRLLKLSGATVNHLHNPTHNQASDLDELLQAYIDRLQSPPIEIRLPSSPTDDMLPLIRRKRNLHAVSEAGDLEGVMLKLHGGADVNERNENQATPLDAASKNGRLEVARALIRNGADVNSRDKYGWTPLHGASQSGHLEVVRLLLALGADVNAREQTQWSSLHLASVNGHIEVVQLLLEQGANVEAMNEESRTSFDEASRSGETEIASLLSQHGSPGSV